MPEQSLSTSTSNSYSVREAATLCGVSPDTIRRRLADDRFPSAFQQSGRTGTEWQIPANELGQVATEEGWDLDLAEAEPKQEAQASVSLDELFDRIQVEAAARADAEAQLKQSLSTTSRLEDQLKQARSDAEHWRSEHDQRTEDLGQLERKNAELDKGKAVAEARVEEVRTQLENERANVIEHQELLKVEQNRLTERDAELVSMGDRATELEKLAAERLSEATKLKESMGWLARRRYEKRN